MKTIITTNGRPNEKSFTNASLAVDSLGYKFVDRAKRSITRMQEEYDSAVLVASANRYELYRIGMDKPFFFHPDTAAFRLKRLMNGEKDPFIEATQLQPGDSFLDCTLGLASDSILASFITKEGGKVLGVEGDVDIAFITSEGLRSYTLGSEELTNAMRRIQVISQDAVTFLQSQPDESWDVIYIDPMFSSPINESTNFAPLRQVGLQGMLTDEWMREAERVCKRRVVVKDHYQSQVFEQFNLNTQIRLNTKFHFGFHTKN
ncbi:class I SAM-dependent methyltransferase [Sporosarcina sp. Marseille-Q4063]|uniref:class I SAM-dependent methyltransferase n=1 Tax=Sporosarcina sp. Marseille-Q4063 TaxID=2810514 RepID=UPI001BAF9991|nr:class I SAM-dependent methyltransferase [Sporosarcina sp. Marseille-Q4063]QUW22398.1 class I SAM-dependent methyltransferase [Sporosarcina sp. Marseille-Q4063]